MLDAFLRRHDILEFALRAFRPPGHETTECMGRVRRVDCGGLEIDEDAPPDLDAAQAGEGEPHQSVEVYFYRCWACRLTLVIARCPDGRLRLRNPVPAAAETGNKSAPAPLAATA